MDPVRDVICADTSLNAHFGPRSRHLTVVPEFGSAIGPIPLAGWTAAHLTLKRVLDVVGALSALVVLLPLFLLVALVVKWSSPGPIFFVQTRAGRGGRAFPCLKFRTMLVGAEQQKAALAALNELTGPVFKIRNDPRLTRAGRILRKYSLDELPQFMNVLLGDMSLIGPRPPTFDEVARYSEHQLRRLSVRPGITGLWQVSGRASITDFEHWVALDLEYIDRGSVWLDLVILAKTPAEVLRARGAA